MSFANLAKFTYFTVSETESGRVIYPVTDVQDSGFFHSLEDLERVFFLTDELSENDHLLEVCGDSFRAFNWIRQSNVLCVMGNDSEYFYPVDSDVSDVNEIDELLSMKIADMIKSHQG